VDQEKGLVMIDISSPPASPPEPRAMSAIYTQHIKRAHVIRKVILRQIAILNSVNPF